MGIGGKLTWRAVVAVAAAAYLVATAVIVAALADETVVGAIAAAVALVVLLAVAFRGWCRKHYRSALIAVGAVVLITGAAYGAYLMIEPAINGSTDMRCRPGVIATGGTAEPRDGPAASSQSKGKGDPLQASPKWRLQPVDGGKGTLRINLDDLTQTVRRASGGVEVIPLGKNKDQPRLPLGTAVNAYLRQGDLSNADGSLGLDVKVFARRQPGGDGIVVCASVERPEDRSAVSPGRYEGTVRVTGSRIRPTDLPIGLTIKASRIETMALAFIVALLSVCLVATTTRPREEEDDAEIANALEEEAPKQDGLALLPAGSGLIAGLAAALVVYTGDPIWGADRGGDTLELITATFAAAAVGLTAAVPATKAVRRRVAKKKAKGNPGRRGGPDQQTEDPPEEQAAQPAEVQQPPNPT